MGSATRYLSSKPNSLLKKGLSPSTQASNTKKSVSREVPVPLFQQVAKAPISLLFHSGKG